MIYLSRQIQNSQIYHIYSDSNTRYVGGSAGIAFWNGDLIMAIRYSSHIHIEGQTRINFQNVYKFHRPYLNNSLCHIGKIILDSDPILMDSKILDIPRSNTHYRGLEDGRLIIWDNRLYIYGTQFTDKYSDGQTIMCYELDNDFNIINIIELPGGYEKGAFSQVFTEKNWMAIPDRPLDFIYMMGVDIEEEPKYLHTIKYSDLEHLKPNMSISQYKGSTPLLKLSDGYISIIHTSTNDDGLNYIHYLIFFDNDLNIIQISNPFHFEQDGIEFSTGLATDGRYLYISYSTTDGTTNLLKTTYEDLITALSEDKIPIHLEHIKIADKIFCTNPIDASQYYWKDWVQNGNKDSLYSHYAILIYYLDCYLLSRDLSILQDDMSVDALILKAYHFKRTNRSYKEFKDIMDQLPHNWRDKIQNKYIKLLKFKELIGT